MHLPRFLRKRERSTLALFSIFAVGLILPVVVFASLTAIAYVRAEQARAVEGAQSLAREVSQAIDRTFTGPQTILQALSVDEELRRGDLEAFHRKAAAINDALGVTIVVRAPGQPRQVLNSSVPMGTALPPPNPDIPAYDQRVISEKLPVVTNLIEGPVQKRLLATVIVPVLRTGEVIYLLAAGIPTENFQSVFTGFTFEEGWLSAVVDSKGVIAARSVNPEEFVGKAVPSDWISHIGGNEGVWQGRNLSGVEVIVAYSRSPQTGWFATVAVPISVLHAPMWKAIASLAGIGFLLLSLSAFLASWASARLKNAVQALLSVSQNVQKHEKTAAIDTPVREINEVGRVLVSAASEAQRREAQLRSILDTVPSSMVMIDSCGIIKSFSAAAEKLFGYSADEACGQNVNILMPEPHHGSHDEYIGNYLRTGERKLIGHSRVVEGQRKDGSRFPVELNIGEARIDDDRFFIGFLRDQTDKLRIEQELRQTQKMEAIGQLTGGVAHDFNNLLTVITGNLEMLSNKVAKKYRVFLDEAQEATELATQLTSSLLAFGRRMPLDPQLTDIGELVSTTSDLLRRTLGETIVIRTAISGGCRAIVDGGQLKSTLLNLAINARDAMPSGGTLTLEVSKAKIDRAYTLQYPEARPGVYVLISISDTGTGMSAEVVEHAFEPFFTTKPHGAGTGLGLSSVYGFVKQSGGHVALYSEPGQGTTVRIYLPLVGSKPSESSDALQEAPVANGEGKLVLVVEDDERLRRLTISRLEQLGYRTAEASDGPQALATLEETPGIELVFTDMIMPGGLNGVDLAEKVHERFLGMPILYTSGYAGPEIVGKAGAHVGSWLKKPYSIADLASALDRAFNKNSRETSK